MLVKHKIPTELAASNEVGWFFKRLPRFDQGFAARVMGTVELFPNCHRSAV